MSTIVDNSDPSQTLGNIYFMTLAAASRVYQLRRGEPAKVKKGHSHCTTALREVQEQKLGLGILLVEGKTTPKLREF